MDDQKQQLLERLKQAQNVLVTVSANPSVDQLAAAIGLTLVLNHLGKHGTAVYSGNTPSTLEFLRPEDTLEKNTDSLRDFIIALDKSKADKLRYKVEDDVVRIFITPYKTSISENDLDFSQGDFNVDVVVALGVKTQQDLDGAITAHGRILHDATVVSINTEQGSELGTIQWTDTSASSLCELIVQLINMMDKSALDSQTATALLTGIVASTDRFSNHKTTPNTMSASAALMAAGANQQLIATQLQAPQEPKDADEPADNVTEDDGDADVASPVAAPREPGTLEIEHDGNQPEKHADSTEDADDQERAVPDEPQIAVDAEGRLINEASEESHISQVRGRPEDDRSTFAARSTPVGLESTSDEPRTRMVNPPQLTGTLTANTVQEGLDPAAESLTQPVAAMPLLSHTEAVLPAEDGEVPNPQDSSTAHEQDEPALQPRFSAGTTFQPTPIAQPNQETAEPSRPVIMPEETLSEIEDHVHSPHVQQAGELDSQAPADDDVDDARSAVAAALNGASDPLQPIVALNAQQLGGDLHTDSVPFVPPAITNDGFNEPTPGNSPADQTLDMPLPGTPLGPQPANIQPSSPLPSQPTNPYQPPQNNAFQPSPTPSVFPGMPPASSGPDQDAPPPVPPPMLPPLQ